jgi:hypothetical protein
MDRFAYALIGSTAAEIPLHGGFDFGISRLRGALEESGRTHQLACLTIPALRHIMLQPGFLQGMKRAIRLSKALNRFH